MANPEFFKYQFINKSDNPFNSYKLNHNISFYSLDKASHLFVSLEDLAIYVKRFNVSATTQCGFFGVSIYKVLSINQRFYA